ncbi:MAG: hypothetical protein HZA95_00135 [Candidatus Vogelbacteria bacterium]|nr:hypothetical protein [Candidatus Vogelbacteria bacterium]
MKHLHCIIPAIAILGVVYLVSLSERTKPDKEYQPAQVEINQETYNQWETKTDSQLPVEVAVTPVEFGKEAKMWKFNVAFTTHSGSLDDDPTQVVVMTGDKGDTYRAISWDGPGPGGHHREGILSFNSITPITKYVDVKVNGVGDIEERSFRWNLSQ